MKLISSLSNISRLLLKNIISINSKSFFVVIISLSLYASIISTLNFMDKPKMGYIDSSKLMEKYPSAVLARKEFDTKCMTWKENVQTLETELVQLNKEILENSNIWTKDIISEKQEIIKKKQMEYAKYGKAINEKAAELEKQIFEPVYAQINTKINEFGAEKGYNIIFGTLSGGNVLYGNNANDLTEEFLGYAKN